jgi:pyridoxamine 5'-phosphate oxidase
MSGVDLAGLRQEYMRESLDVGDVGGDPTAQFRKWFDEAVSAALPMVNAMALATASQDGVPSARMVLLKGIDERGFVFYTDYESRKGRELAANPRAALLFYWTLLEREVRVEGRVEKTSAGESDAYFATRPAGSRLAALASRQSSVIADRQTLERGYAQAQQTHGETPPRPAAWGGYRVLPESIEFWQGRPNRLHDRLVYTKGADERWEIVRLSP